MSTERARIVVAMSGGVDSTVAVALLQNAGHDVMGVTMRLVSSQRGGPDPWEQAIEDARQAASRLGIPHHVADLSEAFQCQVQDYFLSEYQHARTPNPCVRCNQRIKFGALLAQAHELGGQFLATGHYVRLISHEGRHALARAVCREKDQSYVLSGLSQEQLKHVLFPLGGLTKEETRAFARSLGFDTIAEKSDSQDICFLAGGDYRSYVAQAGVSGTPGPILSSTGTVLGTHTGLANYTIGQRKGLGIAGPRPYYVLRLLPERNAVVVGFHEETYATRLTTSDAVWMGIPPQREPFECQIQIRYRHEAVPCTVEPAPGQFTAVFHTPQRAVTPGQWAVLYQDDLVLASGAIDTFE